MADKNEEQLILYIETYDNLLTEKEGDYTAKPHMTGSVGNPQIAKRIMKGGLEVREETILYILDMADQAKAEALAEGKSVKDGMGQYLINIRGSFDGATAIFDPTKHALGVTYTMGKIVTELLKKLKVENRGQASLGPVINSITDSTTGSMNKVLTSGGPAIISGTNLKLMGEDATVGVYLTSDAPNAMPVKVPLVVSNNPSQLTVILPTIEANKQYTLSLTTQYSSSSKTVKAPRTCTLPVLLGDGKGGDEGGDENPDIL